MKNYTAITWNYVVNNVNFYIVGGMNNNQENVILVCLFLTDRYKDKNSCLWTFLPFTLYINMNIISTTLDFEIHA